VITGVAIWAAALVNDYAHVPEQNFTHAAERWWARSYSSARSDFGGDPVTRGQIT